MYNEYQNNQNLICGKNQSRESSNEKEEERKKYYGIAGVNAYGVYDNIQKLKVSIEYYKEYSYGEFDNFSDAKHYAEDIYFNFPVNHNGQYEIEPITTVNWTYHRREIESVHNKCKKTVKRKRNVEINATKKSIAKTFDDSQGMIRLFDKIG